ncbi:MAG: hypothetical protein K6B40_06545, partial [Firmicutes bacterium]|nr:hypothetical protein [Bacillota bacterium]
CLVQRDGSFVPMLGQQEPSLLNQIDTQQEPSLLNHHCVMQKPSRLKGFSLLHRKPTASQRITKGRNLSLRPDFFS